MCNLLRYKAEIQAAHAVFTEFSEVRIVPAIRFKVAPSEPAPVLTLVRSAPEIGMKRFGFRTTKGRQIMARGETVSELRMFRDAFRERRCLILAHGFYDSLDMGAFRQPWHLHLRSDALMCFAGLWETGDDGGNFTIISSAANSVVARVIDRMPVILPQSRWKAWIAPTTSAADLKSMLVPFPAEAMEAYPVTRLVNQRGFESAECIEPVVPEQGELFF